MHPFKKMILSKTTQESVVFDPFDYMVVKFTYEKPTNGTDLDIMIAYDGTGTIYDGNAVGFGQGSTDNIKVPLNITPDADAYLWWANDDAGSPAGPCVEAVVIGVKNLYDDEVGVADNITIPLRVGWYGTIGDGSVTVQLLTYLGGTMSQSGTDIINTGGVLVDDQSFTRQVTSGTGQVTIIHSNLIGTVSYNKTTSTAILS
jgi:hypothetical protein